MTNLEIARAYLRSLETRDGTTLSYYADDAVQTEYPNRVVPAGATRDLAGLRQANERGSQVVTDERYDVVSAVAQDDRVALQVEWSARLNVALGALAAGDRMRAHFGLFMTFRDGKIITQHNYDCFEPF